MASYPIVIDPTAGTVTDPNYTPLGGDLGGNFGPVDTLVLADPYSGDTGVSDPSTFDNPPPDVASSGGAAQVFTDLGSFIQRVTPVIYTATTGKTFVQQNTPRGTITGVTATAPPVTNYNLLGLAAIFAAAAVLYALIKR